MRNILLVIKREYMVRVKKKSFLIMTILAPVLFVGGYALVIWMAISSVDSKLVQVVDESGLFTNEFKDSESLKFSFVNASIDSAKAHFTDSHANALVYIPKNVINSPKSVRIYAPKNVSMELKSDIEKLIEKQIENIKLS